MTDSAINKKSKRAIWIPLLVLITLAACATAGYSYWRMQQQPSASVSAEPAPPPAPVFFALDTFTVNLGDADRVLYIGVTLRMKDEATRARLSEYLPEVRSRLLLLFSRQNAATLATEPNSHFTLIYGNRSSQSMMFRQALADLKDKAETLPRKANEDAGLMARGILVNLGEMDIKNLHGPESYKAGLKLNHGRRPMVPLPN